MDNKSKKVPPQARASQSTNLKQVLEVNSGGPTSNSLQSQSLSEDSDSSQERDASPGKQSKKESNPASPKVKIDLKQVNERNFTKKRSKIGDMESAMKRMDATIDSLQGGKNGPKGSKRALTPRSKRVAQMYEEVKYKEDETILPWQRQLKVNRFMADLQTRKYIEELNDPIVKAQQKIKDQIKHKFVKQIEKADERLILIEQVVFGADGPENRFEKIEAEQSEQRVNQLTNYEFHKDQTSQLLAKFDDENFKTTQKLLKLEGYEKDISNLFEKDNVLEKYVLDALDQLKKEQELFKAEVKDMTDKNNQRIQKFTQEQWLLQDRMDKAEEVQQQQSKFKADMDAQLIQLDQIIHPLKVKKLDESKFDSFVKDFNTKHKQLCQQVDNMTSDVDTASNYMQKYIPMQLQRSITHVLGFVMPTREVAWRLNWYNELKMPMLSAALLTDEGKHNLNQKMRELVELLSNYPTTIMELNTEDKNSHSHAELLPDERLLSLTLTKAKLHTKAKVIIFQRLDEIDRKRQQMGNSDNIRDMHELQVDFGDIQEELFRMLEEENPAEAKLLKPVDSDGTEKKKAGGGQIEDDTDSGLEAQVNSIIEKFTQEHEERVNARLAEMEVQLDKTIKIEQDTMKSKFEMDVSKLEKSIDLVHMSQIHDVQSMRGIHQQFNIASERFDQKLAIVVDLEKAYQQLLLHMKNTSQVVDSLISLNFLTSAENPLNESLRACDPSISPKASKFSPSDARQIYNLNPVLTQSFDDGIKRTDTQVSKDDEPQTTLLRKATDNQRYENTVNNQPTDFEGISDYMQGHLNHHKHHIAKISMEKITAVAASDVNSNTSTANQSTGEILNLQNYFNPTRSSKMRKQATMTSVKSSTKNQAFIHKRNGGNSRFKQYHLGTAALLSPVDPEALGIDPIASQQNVMTPQATTGLDSSSRPKSQAATGFNARIKRNSNLVNNSAIQILRHQSGNSLGGPPIMGNDFTQQPSENSFIDSKGGGQTNNMLRADREKLKSQQSCRTTQNNRVRQQIAVSSSKDHHMHLRHSGNFTNNNGQISSNNVHTTEEGTRYPNTTAQSSTAGGGYDRGRALYKLAQLGNEARQLVKRMDSLILPDQTGVLEGEKRMQKKLQDHRRALNMLPDAEQFRAELMQFQQRLNQQSKAQNVVKKQGGFLTSPSLTSHLNFAKPGIDMNFGISHQQHHQKNLTGDQQVDEQKFTQQKLLEQNRKYTPNRLASEQEFGRVDCALDEQRKRKRQQMSKQVPNHQHQHQHHQEIQEYQEDSNETSLAQQPEITNSPVTSDNNNNNNNNQQMGHIFCKKEVMSSVNRVL